MLNGARLTGAKIVSLGFDGGSLQGAQLDGLTGAAPTFDGTKR